MFDRHKKKLPKSKSIVIHRIGHFGDTLVAIPAINTIHKKFPNHEIYLLTIEKIGLVSPWTILGKLGIFTDVIYYPETVGLKEKLSVAIQLASNLRRLRPEYLFDLAPERSHLQAFRDYIFFKFLSGISGYIAKRSSLVSIAGYRNKNIQNEWKRLQQIVGPEEDCSFVFPINQVELSYITGVLTTLGINGQDPIIALAPGSKMPAKRWKTERFIELINKISTAYPKFIIILVGGADESLLCDSIAKAVKVQIHNLAGMTTIFQLAAILKKSTIYIGNDTGTMHLAAAVGIPCVAIFSARDLPGKWDPIGLGHQVIRRDVACAGCMLEICTQNNMDCLSLITVDDVFYAVKKVAEKYK